jgi:hypothetical protein
MKYAPLTSPRRPALNLFQGRLLWAAIALGGFLLVAALPQEVRAQASFGGLATAQKAGEEDFAGGKVKKSETNHPTSDTLELREHTFEECRKVAEEFVQSEAKSRLFIKHPNNVEAPDILAFYNLFKEAKLTKWAVFLGGDDRPAVYEFIFENLGTKIMVIRVNALTGQFESSSSSVNPSQEFEAWKKENKNKQEPLAYFDFAPERLKELEVERRIKVNDHYQLYSLNGGYCVLFEEENSGKNIVARLGPEKDRRFPTLDQKAYDFEKIKRYDREVFRNILKNQIKKINELQRNKK